MSVFDGLVGQAGARQLLERAAANSPGHAWLFTGPPGSGRSLAARMLAAALECTGEPLGCGECQACRMVMAGGHPDVELVSATGVSISIAQTRDIVSRSYDAPSMGRRRVIIVEDADRMSENTTNVLLKALEEPPESTVWMLCTPSPDDVLPTIRSRCRHVGLVVPPAEDVAELLVATEGVSYERALIAARAAQSHIGRARGLIRDEGAWEDRRTVLTAAVGIRNVHDAVVAAEQVLKILEESKQREAERRENEVEAMRAAQAQAQRQGATVRSGSGRAARLEDDPRIVELRRSLGIPDGAKVPREYSKVIKDFRDELERQRRRRERDGIDRVMIDLLSLYRDVLTVQHGVEVPLVNPDFEKEIQAIAAASDVPQSLRRIEVINEARERLRGNAAPQLTLEAMMIGLMPSR